MPLRSVETMPETVNVRIVRSRGYVCGLRSFKIYLDDQLVCRIRNGEEKELTVAAGTHRVSARVDWCRTEELVVDCYGEERVVMRVYMSSSWMENSSRSIRYIHTKDIDRHRGSE